jgi:hypothetical protein
MEQAAVPESTAQLIIGHKRQSLTHGHYSQGERLRKELREYIGRLRYPNDVMKHIGGGRDGKRKRAGVRSNKGVRGRCGQNLACAKMSLLARGLESAETPLEGRWDRPRSLHSTKRAPALSQKQENRRAGASWSKSSPGRATGLLLAAG